MRGGKTGVSVVRYEGNISEVHYVFAWNSFV